MEPRMGTLGSGERRFQRFFRAARRYSATARAETAMAILSNPIML